MKLHIYSVYDKAVNAFLPPFFARNAGEALRSFSDAANDESHQFRKHSTDYVLFGLGEFDDVAGTFGTFEPMRMVAANEVVSSGVLDVSVGGRKPATNGSAVVE